MIRAAFPLAFPLFCASVLSAGTFRIAGIMVHSRTGAPLDRVTVGIAPATGRTPWQYVVTGDDGRFLFENVPQGNWTVWARRRGFIAQSYGQTSLGSPAIGWIAGPGEETGNIVFPLAPEASIGGVVRDIEGDPAANANVTIMRWGVSNGRRQVQAAGTGVTDDAGRYAVGSLRAGTYYLAVTAEPWYARELVPRMLLSGADAKAYGLQFFPGTTDPRSAAPIAVRTGEQASADVALTPLPAVRLTLRAPGGSSRVNLASEGIGGAVTWWPTPPLAPRMPYLLVPGRYQVWFAGKDNYSNRKTIDVANHDTDVQLTPEHLAHIEAVVKTIGDVMPLAEFSLLLQPIDGSATPRRIAADGVVRFPPMQPGSYRIALEPSTNEAYLDQVSVEGARYEKQLLELSPEAKARLRATVNGNGGTVSGKVFFQDKAAPGATVLMRRKSEDDQDYRTFVTASDGSYRMPALRPGDYLILAVEHGAELEYTNAEVMKPYLERAVTVRVEPRMQATVRLETTLAPVPSRP